MNYSETKISYHSLYMQNKIPYYTVMFLNGYYIILYYKNSSKQLWKVTLYYCPKKLNKYMCETAPKPENSIKTRTERKVGGQCHTTTKGTRKSEFLIWKIDTSECLEFLISRTECRLLWQSWKIKAILKC